MFSNKTYKKIVGLLLLSVIACLAVLKDVHSFCNHHDELEYNQNTTTTLDCKCAICNFDLFNIDVAQLLDFRPNLKAESIKQVLINQPIVYILIQKICTHSPPSVNI